MQSRMRCYNRTWQQTASLWKWLMVSKISLVVNRWETGTSSINPFRNYSFRSAINLKMPSFRPNKVGTIKKLDMCYKVVKEIPSPFLVGIKRTLHPSRDMAILNMKGFFGIAEAHTNADKYWTCVINTIQNNVAEFLVSSSARTLGRKIGKGFSGCQDEKFHFFTWVADWLIVCQSHLATAGAISFRE